MLIPLYAKSVPADALPAFYQTIQTKFKGDYNAYIDALYDNSIFSNEKNFNAFISNPTVEAIDNDLAIQYSSSKNDMAQKLRENTVL